jgi:hypothetical protein
MVLLTTMEAAQRRASTMDGAEVHICRSQS